MNFGMIMLNQSIKTKQNYATRILIVLLLILGGPKTKMPIKLKLSYCLEKL